MTLLLAAVGAVLTALVELSVGPYLRVGGIQPHPVLVFAVVMTIVIGFEVGLLWAFVGGLALDVLAQRPLGSSAFAILLSVGGSWLLTHWFARARVLLPILATFLFSLSFSLIGFVLLSALAAPLPVADPVSAVLPAAVYDAGLAAVLGPVTLALNRRRSGPREQFAW